MVVVGSELGLLFGAGVVISGPIWASAEWGVPWDWGDVRLNTYALLTAVALFLVMSIRSQPDGEGTRDSLSAVGLFGFVLVPITALATTLWQSSHPGVVVIESEETGLDPEIKLVLFIGSASFFLLFVGLVLLNEAIMGMSEEIDDARYSIYEEASN
jgi:heme exporter protein C